MPTADPRRGRSDQTTSLCSRAAPIHLSLTRTTVPLGSARPERTAALDDRLWSPGQWWAHCWPDVGSLRPCAKVAAKRTPVCSGPHQRLRGGREESIDVTTAADQDEADTDRGTIAQQVSRPLPSRAGWRGRVISACCCKSRACGTACRRQKSARPRHSEQGVAVHERPSQASRTRRGLSLGPTTTA